MNEDEVIDIRLAALLAEPERGPDEAFVGRMHRAVAAEQKIEASRRAAWRRFGYEAVASAAVAVAFVLIGRMGPLEVALGQGPLSPATAGVIILAIWFGVELRPGAMRA